MNSTQIDLNQATDSAEPSASPSPEPVAPVNPVNLTVSPVTLNLETDPGKPVTSVIKVLNNGLEEEYLELELQQFTADELGSNPVISEFAISDQHQNWVSFDQTKFLVKPGEWQTIKVTFSPPDSAALTYYYAILVKRQLAPEESATTIVSGVPAILMLTNVRSPYAKLELQLSKFLSQKKVYEFLPAEFTVAIKNSGNTHLAPLGNIFIDKGSALHQSAKGGKDVATLTLNKESGLVLPNSERIYQVEWAEGFPVFETEVDKDGNKKTKLNWDFTKLNQLRIGKYTAHLLFIYDNGQRDVPIESKLTFWVIPWRILLVIAVIGTLTLFGLSWPIVALIKRLKNKKSPPPASPKKPVQPTQPNQPDLPTKPRSTTIADENTQQELADQKT